MKALALALFCALALPASALAQPPMVPPAPAPAPSPLATIDQLYAKILDLRAKRADLKKQSDEIAKLEAAAVAELRARLKELQDLGLIDPPAPPKPPAPVPPADQLAAKLAAAFVAAAGTDAQKKEWAKDLAALYRAAAKLASDPAISTASAFKTKYLSAANTLIGPDSLVEVRKAVAAELAAILPAAEADLTSDQRAAAAALFGRLAGILDGLGQ